MEIRPRPQQPDYDPLLQPNESIIESMAVELDVHNKKVQVRRSKIKDVAKGLAEIAYNIGETNNPDEFAEEMTDNIYQALKKVQKIQKRKKDH